MCTLTTVFGACTPHPGTRGAHRLPQLARSPAALQEETASQSDVVGQADAPAASGVMSLFQRATASSQDRADVFALGDRAALLHHLDQAAIIPHVADSEGRKYPFEVRFGLRQDAK